MAEVYSPTRPAGEKINELYINDQTNQVKTGLGDATSGVGQINDGLTAAEEKLSRTDTSGLANVEKLIAGTNDVKNGVGQLGNAVGQLTEGFHSGATVQSSWKMV